MPPTSGRWLLADTGFWIAAFDPKTDGHARAAALLEDQRDRPILMPWPIMYEVLRTRTVRNRNMSFAFDRVIRRPKVIRWDDVPYRDACLDTTLAEAASGRRSISLVDMVVRAVLEDPQVRVSTLLTFNVGDFHDVCRNRGVAIWPPPDAE